MAGRITYRNGPHPSQVGHLVEGISLDEQSLGEITNLIGRALTAAERDELEEWLAMVKDMTDQSSRVPIRDTAKTLEAILREGDGTIHTALEDSNEDAKCFVTGKLHKLYRGLGLQPWNFDAFTPEQLRAAVLLAQHYLPKDTAGAPEKRANFSAGFVQFWRVWTGEEPRTSSHDAFGNSPDVECAQILALAIGDEVGASSMAKSLRKAKKR